MEVSARDIQEQQFHDSWRGYNQEEVDDFLDEIAETIERLSRENEALRGRLRELEDTAHSSKATEEMLKKTLLNAQQTADQAIAEAKAKAEKMIAEAHEKVQSADHDLEGRVAGIEEDVRHKTDEIQSRYTKRKSELDDSLVRLESFENAIKGRLRSFLEEQLNALETLGEQQRRPIVDVAEPVAVETPVVDAPETPETPEIPEAVEEPEFDLPATAEHPIVDELGPGEAAQEMRVAQDEEEPIDEAIYELDSETATVFDSLPQQHDDEPASLEDFRPFDDDAAAVEGRRRRRLFRRRVDDWA
ncbi:MAG: cell division initiation protein [Actinomycetota bacterium]|nr:cell division initiation protein [Actinomycetota bacterium]